MIIEREDMNKTRRRKSRRKNSDNMLPIPNVTPMEAALPTDVSHLLPKFETLPSEYQKCRGYNGDAPGCALASELFFKGGKLPEPKPGVDARKASLVVKACLGSFEPKHEHKIAGVGYLLNQWFKL